MSLRILRTEPRPVATHVRDLGTMSTWCLRELQHIHEMLLIATLIRALEIMTYRAHFVSVCDIYLRAETGTERSEILC